MLASWTDVPKTDLFLAASKGSSWFRINDLLDLSAYLEVLLEKPKGSS